MVGDLKQFSTGLEKYTTSNPVHAQEVNRAVEQLQNHFKSEDPPRRPLNCLILGGPGSGKTYLAKQLKDATEADFKEFNLSQFHEPGQIQNCFEEIADHLKSNPNGNLIVFFDEFDVKIGGVSAIQFLIQPIYDGEMKGAGKAKSAGKGKVRERDLEFKRAAFLFSGSYLKERRIFDRIASEEQFDLAGMLFDTCHATHRDPQDTIYRDCRAEIREELLAVAAYDPIRRRMSADRDILSYVRSLEKIVDFASRINGFVLELRNLNTPLDATRDRYRIELEYDRDRPDERKNSVAVAPNPQIAAQLIALVDGLRRGPVSEWFYAYPDPQQPVLEYKNLLLTDRLARVVDLLKRTRKAKQVRISRALLNYLVTVPLVHGMRSLSTIIESLAYHDGGLEMPTDTGVLERNIGRFHEFENPNAVWARIERKNPEFSKKKNMPEEGRTIITLR